MGALHIIDWDRFHNWREVTDYLNTEYPTVESRPVWALCLLPKARIGDLPKLAERKSFKVSSFRITLTQKTNDLWIVRMQYKGRIRERKVAIACRVMSNGWILLFNTKTELGLTRILLRRLYPHVSRAHLRSPAIEELTRRLLPSDSYYIKAIGCDAIRPSQKRPRDEEQGSSTRARLSGPETQDLLDLIREHVSNVWVDNLEFEVREKRTEEALMTAIVTREGLCRVEPRPGAFDLFEKMLVGVVTFGRSRENSFAHMDRRMVADEIRISPVNVLYDQNIQQFQIRQVSRDLTRNRIASIIHSGNPYFLAIAQDYLDGSTFSVAILDDTLTVVPIRQNSDAAFVRILDMLYARIGEGKEQLPFDQITREA
jgi:hypothetical protein